MKAMIPFDEMQQIGRAMAKSGYFQDARDEAQAIVKVLAGAEIGLGPFAAMSGIHIISGKPVLGANVLATLIKNDARYNYRVVEHTDAVCDIAFYEDGKQIGTSRVTLDELKRAGSKNLDKYPKNMLFARAISNGAKWHTPGIFGGTPVYTPDEFDMEVDEDGDVIAAAVVIEAPPVQVAAPEVQKPAQVVVPNGKPARPYAPEVLRDALLKSAAAHDEAGKAPTEKQAQMLAPNIEQLLTIGGLAEPQDARHMLTGFLFGKPSTQDLTGGEALALVNWINRKKDGAGNWMPDLLAVHEALNVLDVVTA